MKIGIVGSGIVGRLLAWHLCQANHEVHLFTKGSEQSEDACSIIAAGMISPYAELPLLTLPLHQIGCRAFDWWPIILNSLPYPVHYQTKGTLVVCSPKQKALLQHFIGLIQYKLPAFSLAILSERELNAIEPALSNVIGCHLPEAQVPPPQLFKAMNDFFAKQGVIWHSHHDVNGITSSNIDCEKAFDKTVDCRGMGAKPSLPNLRGVRGEIIQCYAKEVQLQHTIRLLHPRFPCYIVPQENHHFAIGATQIESESTQGVTFRSALELMGQASMLHPGFFEASIISLNVGCRPTTDNHMPLVNECEGVLSLNGMSRHGFMFAPELTAQVAAKWKQVA